MECDRPPVGWTCALARGHSGPCPAREDCKYEYGIVLLRRPEPPHRTGMSLVEAVEWMDTWLEDGGRPDVFSMIRREVAPWQQIGYLPVQEPKTGLAGVREAVKRARGGDAPAQVVGYA